MSADDANVEEFDRSPIPDSAQLGPAKFWGMYAGEHAAGTEFMIGPLFLSAGASLQDLIVGLLLGNVLAVLTWRYLVTPIAVSRRLTLYYQLERIAGSSLVKIYNAVNGVLFCFLAGAMVTVSASAVGIPFGIFYEVPESTLSLGAPTFTALVFFVGVAMTAVAAGGYERVARFANLAAPWMIIVFAACGLISLVQMNANSVSALQQGTFWSDAVAFVQEREGETQFGFWQIVIFAWLCNAAMHFGMSDLSIFRFARYPSSGWAPAVGMFLGHYMAWIAAALMLAAQIKLSQDHSANPGALAWGVLGWTGILCVVIAGWTTANPTIYRAGLAFQGIVPNSTRMAMTVAAGIVATIAGAFPNLSAQLLGFVGTYGTILGPMGAVIFVDYYLMKKLGMEEEYAIHHRVSFNAAVFVAWVLPVSVGLYLIFWQGLFAAYLVIPAWLICGILYLLMSKITQRRNPDTLANARS
ncbi:purine-cytosine permease family protein [Bremerella sp. P1]|uniref:purine-cytosine permease family protein n=1 Tax=Bremerella sp. P1 TaxID=3026424 RepID=UPI002368BB46|nr:hypothetical protein [Bremerella sp. P1]WDI41033.1 hypothetical protein PSR63_21425 [Bremerella sp. P1]